MFSSSLSTNPKMCTFRGLRREPASTDIPRDPPLTLVYRVQVNLAAESGEMGILAQHVPSVEQLKPGLVEIIEESGGSKQFFRTLHWTNNQIRAGADAHTFQFPGDSPSCSPTLFSA